MTGWCGKYHCSLSLVSFSSAWSTFRTYPALTSVLMVSWYRFLVFRLSAGVVLGTWAAPLQRRSCSVTPLRPLATEVLLHIFHRWIAWFAPTSWLLVALPLNFRWHRSLKRRFRCPTIYSIGLLVCHLQLMLLLWQELLPFFAGSGPFKTQPIFDFTAHGAVLSSDFLNSNGWWMS